MKLLGSGGSPYVRKVRIVFAEKRIPYEYVIASPASPEVGAANPLAKIPALVMDNGKGLYDSAVIVEYLDGSAPDNRLIPDTFADRIEVKRWEALADGIMDATVAISHEDRVPAAQRQGPDWYAKQQKKIDGGLAAMARDLGKRDFCHGDGFTLADIACGTALGYLDRVLSKVDWRKAHPTLHKLADRLAARESFKTTYVPPA